jgi:hypothetical protein
MLFWVSFFLGAIMIPSPYRFEPLISDQDLAKLGILAMRWSHIEHVVANCLKVMLRLSDDEAIVMVFPLGIEQRLNRIQEISKISPLIPHAQAAFDELRIVMRGVQYVRNSVVHSIVVEDDKEDHVFHLRSAGRTLTKAQIFSMEEWTNYASHLARALRYALGFKNQPEPVLYEWPERPAIPEFLPDNCKSFPDLKKSKQQSSPSVPRGS